MKHKITLIVLIVSVLFLSACSQATGLFQQNTNNNPERDYFVGTEGVNMRFSNPGSPPPRMYYYSDADPDDNGFQIALDVQNVGSSVSRGGLYVSGYDPYMIRIKDIDIPRLNGGWGDCIIDLGHVGGYDGAGWDSFRGSIGCSETGLNAYSSGADNWGVAIRSIGDLGINIDHPKWSWLENVGFSYDNQFGNPSVGFNIGNDFNLDFLNRGHGMLTLLSGLDFARFNGKEYYLVADDANYPGGERTTVMFEGQVRNWPRGLDRTKPINFIVTNCFLYATYATPEICVDPAPYNTNIEKSCRPNEITYNGGNGAPVAVTSVQQENTGRSIFFTINIANVDNGQVFDMGYAERCSPYYPGRVSPKMLDKVYILDARIGQQNLLCTPDRGDGVRLVNGQGQFRCKYNLEFVTAKSAYSTPLIIEVGYGYSQTMRRQMTIKRVI